MRGTALLMATVGLVAALVGGTTAAATPATSHADPATASAIDAFIQKERADLKLNGVAVVVISQGSVTFDRSYGGVTRDTPFVLGSTSKQFTALVVQQLIAKGKLSLDDTVGELLRPLGGDTSPFADVTIEQLLSHTSGISTDTGTADVFDPAPAFTSLTAETRHVLTSSPASQPGTGFEYSNANYTLLGSIIESVTGQAFDDALQSLVAQPLGLTATTSDLQLAQKNGLDTGHYTWLGAIDSTTPGPRWPMGAPSAYTTSTAADLTTLLQAELGQPSGIDPAVFGADHAPLTTVDSVNRYASGWYVRPFWELHDQDQNYDDPSLPLIYEHDGDTARETSYLAFVPDLGLGVVVLSNTGLGTDTGRMNDFDYRLLHTIVGTTANPRVVDPIVSAAPALMVAVPLLQVGALIWLVASFVRPRRSRAGRWIPRVAAALITLVTLLVAFVVVPSQNKQSLLDHAWWAAVPDLAVSIAVSLVLAAACVVVSLVALVRQRSGS